MKLLAFSAEKSQRARVLTWKDAYNAAKRYSESTAWYGVEPSVDKVLSKNSTYREAGDLARERIRKKAITAADIALSENAKFFEWEMPIVDFQILRGGAPLAGAAGLFTLWKTVQVGVLPLIYYSREFYYNVMRHILPDHEPTAPEIIGPALITAFFTAFAGFAHAYASRVKRMFADVSTKMEDAVNAAAEEVHKACGAGFAGRKEAAGARPFAGQEEPPGHQPIVDTGLQACYEILGATPSMSHEMVRRAFRAKALEYHPDLHPEFRNADPKLDAAQFKKVQEAYAKICDAQGW